MKTIPSDGVAVRRTFSLQLLPGAATGGARTLPETVAVRQANAADWRRTAHCVQHGNSGKSDALHSLTLEYHFRRIEVSRRRRMLMDDLPCALFLPQ